MGRVEILGHTTKHPIGMIGKMAGVCYDADTSNELKNYERGLDCLENNHGRTFEFPDVYMILDECSARIIREWYTHIGGMPTRLQASTRYIDYQKGFDYYIPPSIRRDSSALSTYLSLMTQIQSHLLTLDRLGIPKEDSANGLPLGMLTKVVCKHNLRNLIDMSRQRMCNRAYHEYRMLFNDLCEALREYSEEWRYIVDHYFMPKCEYLGYCTESKSCGRKPKKEKKC